VIEQILEHLGRDGLSGAKGKIHARERWGIGPAPPGWRPRSAVIRPVATRSDGFRCRHKAHSAHCCEDEGRHELPIRRADELTEALLTEIEALKQEGPTAGELADTLEAMRTAGNWIPIISYAWR
jgi:hypothetical protein